MFFVYFKCWHALLLLRFDETVAHSPYGRAAYANVNGLDSGSALAGAMGQSGPVGGSGPGSSYHSHQEDPDDQQQQYHQQDFGMPASPTRRMPPPPPSRSSGVGGGDGTYQPRPPPPVPAEAMASLNIGVDKSGSLCLSLGFFLVFSLLAACL